MKKIHNRGIIQFAVFAWYC